MIDTPVAKPDQWILNLSHANWLNYYYDLDARLDGQDSIDNIDNMGQRDAATWGETYSWVSLETSHVETPFHWGGHPNAKRDFTHKPWAELATVHLIEGIA